MENWKSRFGYLMVAIGASIGLGNVWKFPYLVYRGGGAVFIFVYIILVLILAKPMVEMETAIGRNGKADTVSVFEKINKKWGFVGWIANVCTLMINFYYVVVGGWVAKYAYQFIFACKVFTELKIFYLDNKILRYNQSVKTDLNASKIYKTVLEIIQKC